MSTWRRRLAGALLGVTLSACGGGGGGGSGSPPAASPAPVSTPAPAPLAGACLPATRTLVPPTLGLGVHPPFDATFWRAIDDLGVKWLRVDLYWDRIEPIRGQANWSAYEQFITEAQQRQVQVLFIINHPPAWAHADAAQFPALAQAFAREAGQWAQRRVAAWEAFNEPNLSGYGWPFRGLSAAESATLYADTAAAVNAGLRASGDPAPVIAGAISPSGHEPMAFIEAVFARLPAACFDAISIHPYGGEGRLPEIRQAVRQQMQRLQARNVPVWITEYGSDNPADHERLLADALAQPGPAEPFFWFALRDFNVSERYGLFDLQGQPRPVYSRFKQAARAVP